MTKKRSSSVCALDGIPWGQHGSGFNPLGIKSFCQFRVSPDCTDKLEMTARRYRQYGNCCKPCDSFFNTLAKHHSFEVDKSVVTSLTSIGKRLHKVVK